MPTPETTAPATAGGESTRSLDVALTCLHDAAGRSRWARNRLRRESAKAEAGSARAQLLGVALQRLEEAEEELEIVAGFVQHLKESS